MTLVDSSVSPLLAARVALASDIQTATGYACHDSRPAAINTPCVVLESAGWQPHAGSGFDIYRVRVTVLYASKDETDMGNAVEELARLAYVAGKDSGWKSPDVPEPGAVTLGSSEYAAVQFTLTKPLEME